MAAQKTSVAAIPIAGGGSGIAVSDSLEDIAKTKLQGKLRAKAGFSDASLLAKVESNAYKSCGASWFTTSKPAAIWVAKSCKDWEEVEKAVASTSGKSLSIILSGTEYKIGNAFSVRSDIKFSAGHKKQIRFYTSLGDHAIELAGNGHLRFTDLNLDLSGIKSLVFITTDISGSSNHGTFSMGSCSINNRLGIFFQATKSSVLDSMMVSNCKFNNNNGTLFSFDNEIDKKGYYNVERLKMIGNTVNNHAGQIINLLRGGNDESTMGPWLLFSNNKLTNVNDEKPLIQLNGIQKTFIEKNTFSDCNPEGVVVEYIDAVRSAHIIQNNIFQHSGSIAKDKFVIGNNNVVK